MAAGELANTDKFRGLVLPYFFKPELLQSPLILSSVGRWEGEEYDVIEVAAKSLHPINAALILNISEAEIKNRWHTARTLQDRGQRADDKDLKILDTRIDEFMIKTMPVIETYRKRGLLLTVNGHQSRDDVYNEVVEQLSKLAQNSGREVALE